MTTEKINGQTVVYNHVLPPRGYKCINLLGFLFVRYGTTLTDKNIRHEYTHTLQMRETLYIGFYLLYALLFIVAFLYYWNWKKSYKMIAFELEANDGEDNEDYNTSRTHYAWAGYVRYIFKYSEIYGD